MSWLIIALVLIAAFGPILWVLPSRQDRRLARMRSRARTLGITVDIVRVRNTSPSAAERVTAGGRVRAPVTECVAYRLPTVRKLAHAPSLEVLRDPGAAESGLPGGWHLERSSGGDVDGPEVARWLEALPADALGLATEPRTVSIYWRERADAGGALEAVDALAGVLHEMRDDQRARHARIEARIAADREGRE